MTHVSTTLRGRQWQKRGPRCITARAPLGSATPQKHPGGPQTSTRLVPPRSCMEPCFPNYMSDSTCYTLEREGWHALSGHQKMGDCGKVKGRAEGKNSKEIRKCHIGTFFLWNKVEMIAEGKCIFFFFFLSN